MLRLAQILPLLLIAIPLQAQGTGSIGGAVSDPAGARIAGARVTVVNRATNLSRTVATDSEGSYLVSPLSPAAYQITVEQSGFQRYTRSGIQLQVDERARIDVELRVGAVSEVVEVTGEAPAINTQDAVLRNVVDARQIGRAHV